MIAVCPITRLRGALSWLAGLRDAALPKLISGELRLRDAEHVIGRATLPSDAEPSDNSDRSDCSDASDHSMKRRGRCPVKVA